MDDRFGWSGVLGIVGGGVVGEGDEMIWYVKRRGRGWGIESHGIFFLIFFCFFENKDLLFAALHILLSLFSSCHSSVSIDSFIAGNVGYRDRRMIYVSSSFVFTVGLSRLKLRSIYRHNRVQNIQ